MGFLRFLNSVQKYDNLTAFLKKGGQKFVLDFGKNLQEEYGIDDEGWTRGGLLVDLNYDGWLDLVVRHLHELPKIFMARCGSERSLVGGVRQSSQNHFAVGARVEAVTESGTFTRWILAGGHSTASSGPSDAHFGLGVYETIQQVRVIWTDGAVSAVDNPVTNQRLLITRN